MPLEKANREFSNLFGPAADCGQEKHLDWHKLASVDISDLNGYSGTDASALQEHLTYIASCDATTQLDLSKQADCRTLLKLFRISQLLIQNLLAKSKAQESELSKVKDERNIYMDKHAQTRSKLLQQITEAKKMKSNNRNLRDTVKYINSVAIAKGILQPVKCDFCYKIFRDNEYLRLHTERKHLVHQQAASTVSHNDVRLLEASSYHYSSQPDEIVQQNHKVILDIHQKSLQMRDKMNPHDCEKIVRESIKNQFGKVAEIERKCTAISKEIINVAASFQEEKIKWKVEREKNRDAMNVLQQQKVTTEENLLKQLKDMNLKIKALEENKTEGNFTSKTADKMISINSDHKTCNAQSKTYNQDLKDKHRTSIRTHQDTIENKITNLLQENSLDISHLRAKLIAQKLVNNEVSEENSEEYSLEPYFNAEAAVLSSITEMSAEKEADNSQEDSIYDINSLPSEYETKRTTSKLSYNANNKDDTVYNNKTLLMNNIYFTKNKNNILNDEAKNSDSVTENKAVRANRHTKIAATGTNPEINYTPSNDTPKSSSVIARSAASGCTHKRVMYATDDSESNESSCSSNKNNCDCKMESPRREKITKLCSQEAMNETENNAKLFEKEYDNYATAGVPDNSDSNDNGERDNSEEISSLSLQNLEGLLKENPNLWIKLREATNEVVNNKIFSLEVAGEEIDKETFKKAIQNLRDERIRLAKKYSNFRKLRKSIHHRVKTILKIKESEVSTHVKTIPNKSQKPKTFNALKHASQAVTSKLNKRPDFIKKIRKISCRTHNAESTPNERSPVSNRNCDEGANETNAAEVDSDSWQEQEPLQDKTVAEIHDHNRSNLEQRRLLETKHDDSSLTSDMPSERNVLTSTNPSTNVSPSIQHVQGIDNCAYSSESFEDSATSDANENSCRTETQKSCDQLSVIEENMFDEALELEEKLSLKDIRSCNEPKNMKYPVYPRPQTRIDNLFHSTSLDEEVCSVRSDDDQEINRSNDFAENHEIITYPAEEYKPIKLKVPTGVNVIKLKQQIESQLQQRQKCRLAGAVDTVAGENSDEEQHETKVTKFSDAATDNNH